MDRRQLADWTSEDGPQEQWLAQWAAQGWRPEFGYGVPLQLNGREVHRWAMIYRGPDDR